ncbi:DUF998 domain-containing protein [Undibacterium pigrum]|uniref:Uncharacterized protein n=1 Tax=Undibacterium pigrum TaxID=401470 RepID=A0A318J2V0_9BURK|nr:DUF998 domain-containing protein [Undibacterium pigrum]PXX41463.1 hypothetical protein DFR42_107114 [Undibacterium pigrum]
MNQPDRFTSLVVKLRWALWLYLPGLVAGCFMLYMLLGMGARHGGEAAMGQVLMIVVPLFLVMLFPPLALLSNSTSVSMRLVQTIGIIQLLLACVLLGGLVFFSSLQPKFRQAKFALLSRSVVLEKVTATAYIRPELGSAQTPLGLTIVSSVRITDDIVLDRYGNAILEALEGGVQLVEMSSDKRVVASFTSFGDQTVSLNGRPLRDLPALANYSFRESDTQARTVLPAGLYQINQVFLFPGLNRGPYVLQNESGQEKSRALMRSSTVCKAEHFPQYEAQEQTQTQDQKRGITALLEGKVKFPGRSINVGFVRKADIQYPYNVSAWKASFEQSSLPLCIDLEREASVEKSSYDALEKSKKEKRDYLDGSINPRDSELYAEACNGNEAALRQRIEEETKGDGSSKPWMPLMQLSSVIRDCAIKRHDLAIFSLLAPAFYQQGKTDIKYFSAKQSQEEVCRVLSDLHAYRRLDFLEALVALKLPIDCEGKQLWRLGIVPNIVDETPENNSVYQKKLFDASLKRNDHLQWIKVLNSQKLDLCQSISVTIAGRERHAPLLNLIIAEFPPELILAVLKTGCDPQTILQTHYEDDRLFSPALSWTLRRHRRKDDYQFKEVVSDNKQLIAQIDQRMRLNGEELNQVNGGGVTSVFIKLVPRILESPPQLLKILMKAGAKPNAGLKTGETWFFPFLGSNVSDETDKLELAIALLDVLSDTELRQVLNQANKHIDKIEPGLYALNKPRDPKNFPAPLRDYVCKRRVLDCR